MLYHSISVNCSLIRQLIKILIKFNIICQRSALWDTAKVHLGTGHVPCIWRIIRVWIQQTSWNKAQSDVHIGDQMHIRTHLNWKCSLYNQLLGWMLDEWTHTHTQTDGRMNGWINRQMETSSLYFTENLMYCTWWMRRIVMKDVQKSNHDWDWSETSEFF